MSKIDMTSDATLLASLKAAYYSLIAGSQEQIVEFDAGNGQRQSVTYHKADINKLKAEITTLEAKVSGAVKRFGLRAGGMT